MNSLRAKIALLLVTSIISVVALITLAGIFLFRAPRDDVVNNFAHQLILMEKLANDSSTTELAAVPAAGQLDEDHTELIRGATERLGKRLDVRVTFSDQAGGRQFQTISVRVGTRGWLIMDLFLDPPSALQLWSWFSLVTLAVGAVALVGAYRMTKPLALLEGAIESVGPDGILPTLPEHGPAEIRATAVALNSLSARLKRAMESRMRLVAAAGHDLRTPLTRMRLRAEFVGDEEDRALWLKDIDELECIADSAMQLVREETSSTPLEVIQLDDLVKSVAAELRAQSFEIEVADTTTAYVRANRLALSRALRNILINAATHGVRGVVRVGGGEVAKITISDDGPGIASDLLDQIFEPFFRADPARQQKIPGAGLGLTISREIIRRAGGDIRIANRPEGGLVQVVELPSINT